MNPNTFLKTFWRMEVQPKIFVAMSFAKEYDSRFHDIIAPAICDIAVSGVQLQPYRVDLSKTGDAILTDIIDGIAHSTMFLADVSIMGYDSKTSVPYRNGNVMYEVGLALACRQPSEVLLIRDDQEKFLFDVSTIPHMKIDFSDKDSAKMALQNELCARINMRNHINDARVQSVIARLSQEELTLLKSRADYSATTIWGFRDTGSVNFLAMAGMPRLLDKGIIRVVGKFDEGHPGYQLTALGNVVAKLVQSGLRELKAVPPKVEESDKPGETENDDGKGNETSDAG